MSSLLIIHVLLLQTNDPHADIIYRPMTYYCAMNNSFVWLLLVYGFKGIVLVFGLFLAWETRKVKIAALNDSHHIGKSAYYLNFVNCYQLLTSANIADCNCKTRFHTD